MTERFWDMTVAHFADKDGAWPVQVWGKHEASHPTRVREALATALDKAPECADVIAALIWRNMILENRMGRSEAMAETDMTREVLAKLIDALLRKGTEQDGNWGHPTFHDELRALAEVVKAAPSAPRSP